MMNRKGDSGDWVNFGGFFLICLVLGGGIALGIVIFFGEGYNFKQAESEILFDSVRDCFLERDFFDEAFNFSMCGIDEGVLRKDRLVLVSNLENGEEYSIGVRSYEVECDLNIEERPYCSSEEVVKGGERFLIITGSGADSRRILR